MCCRKWCVFVVCYIMVIVGLFDGLVDVVCIFWGEGFVYIIVLGFVWMVDYFVVGSDSLGMQSVVCYVQICYVVGIGCVG